MLESIAEAEEMMKHPENYKGYNNLAEMMECSVTIDVKHNNLAEIMEALDNEIIYNIIKRITVLNKKYKNGKNIQRSLQV